jgi:peptidoglycan/LPS O-acetylase OafA/YrhL
MTEHKVKKIYFPSLNGIRAIAALLVVFFHIENEKEHNKLANLLDAIPSIKMMGNTGVTLFFVLSGFLITYLLYVERKETKTIKIFQFYIRRILRIWPLYFLIIIITLSYDCYINNWAYTHDFLGTKLFFYIFFLPNLSMLLFSSSGFPSQLWSVGSEEQFYLIWPHLIKRNIIKSLKGLFLLVVVFCSIRYLFFVLDKNYTLTVNGINIYNLLWRFLYYFRIDCMAIGAIGAYVYFNKQKFQKVLSFIYHKYLQILNVFCIALIFILNIQLGVFQDTLFAFFFIILILNVATNHKSVINLELPVFNFLGKISYGLYVYHPLIIIILLKLFNQNNMFNIKGLNILFSISVLIFSIIISYLSYRYFENPFLKLKKKYSQIISGNDAK